MTAKAKIKFFLLKCSNFLYFEIRLNHRIQFFANHVRNLLFKKYVRAETWQVKIKDAFVISLRDRHDRRSCIRDLFSSQKLNFKFHEGNFIQYIDPLKKYFTSTSIQCLSHGALGCALSHIQLWERISKREDGLYLIFEDDIIFSDSFKENLQMLEKNYPSNCDIFYLGSRNNRLRDILEYTDANYVQSFNPRMGAFAYAITPRGAEKLLSSLIPIHLICGGIDTALGILVRNRILNAYQFYPTQVFHNNALSSNIFNPSIPKKVLHKSAIFQWPYR